MCQRWGIRKRDWSIGALGIMLLGGRTWTEEASHWGHDLEDPGYILAFPLTLCLLDAVRQKDFPLPSLSEIHYTTESATCGLKISLSSFKLLVGCFAPAMSKVIKTHRIQQSHS